MVGETPDSPLTTRETVYQNLAVSPALDIASNLYLGREERRAGILGSVFRMLDTKGMRQRSEDQVRALGITTLQDMSQAVESLSGGQRQAVAVARAAAFGSKVVILDEPTAALGVRESGQVLQMIRDLRDRGLPVILISHSIAARLRGRGPDPHPASRAAGRRCDPADAHPAGGGRDHDGGTGGCLTAPPPTSASPAHASGIVGDRGVQCTDPRQSRGPRPV